MNNRLKSLKPVDCLAFLAASVALIFVFLPSFADRKGETIIRVNSSKGEWLYPTTASLEFRPAGIPGTCLVSIRNRSAKVLESNCPKKICMQMATASKPGDWIACLPHKVFIRIESAGKPADEPEIDALST